MAPGHKSLWDKTCWDQEQEMRDQELREQGIREQETSEQEDDKQENDEEEYDGHDQTESQDRSAWDEVDYSGHEHGNDEEPRTENQGAIYTEEVFHHDWKDFPIRKLPFRVREEIFKYLIVDPVTRVFLPGLAHDPRPTPIPWPTLARAGDRMLRLEVIRVALMRSEMEVHSGGGNRKLQAYLGSIDLSKLDSKNLKDGFDAVTSLRFPHFSRFPLEIRLDPGVPNLDIELMVRCKNLKKVNIRFVFPETCDKGFRESRAPGGEKTAELLCHDYRLHRILGLKNLQRLELDGNCSINPQVGLMALKTWFDREFQKQVATDERMMVPQVTLPAKRYSWDWVDGHWHAVFVYYDHE